MKEAAARIKINKLLEHAGGGSLPRANYPPIFNWSRVSLSRRRTTTTTQPLSGFAERSTTRRSPSRTRGETHKISTIEQHMSYFTPWVAISTCI